MTKRCLENVNFGTNLRTGIDDVIDMLRLLDNLVFKFFMCLERIEVIQEVVQKIEVITKVEVIACFNCF